MIKHQEHIVCIKSDRVSHRNAGLVDYELSLNDIMLGQRAVLEHDTDFRQVLPISIFVHDGKVWAYERTSKGGESRLHNKIAIAVGGHWDMADIQIEDGVMNLQASLDMAINRELTEEVILTSKIIKSYRLPQMICSDATEVDKVHLGVVWIHELDGDGLVSAEDALETVGFVSPKELISGSYNIENWAKIICEMLIAGSNI